jgi:hypothetical protein
VVRLEGLTIRLIAKLLAKERRAPYIVLEELRGGGL